MTDLNALFLADEMRLALAADVEDEALDQAAQAEADCRQRAAEEQAAIVVAETAAEAFAEAEPPDDLIVDVTGLLPQRARLVRFVAWVDSLQNAHDTLVSSRESLLATAGVASMSRKALSDLIAADRSGLVALMAAGGDLTKHQLRSAERKKLEAKLVDDEHTREVSLGALSDVEQRADILEQQLIVLRGRHESFVAAAVMEIAVAEAGSKLIAQMDQLQTDAMKVFGAFGAVQTLRGIAHHPRHHRIQLPTPQLPGEHWITATDDVPGHSVARPGYGTGAGAGYTIDFPVHLQLAEQKRWTAMAATLLANPRAELETK